MNPSRTCQKCKAVLPAAGAPCSRCLDRADFRKYFRRALVAAGILIALVALFYLIENWRGLRAWNQTKARLEAKGEKVDWAAFVPKSRVPDDQNVFQHPFLQEYAIKRGWKGKNKELNWFDPGFIGHGLPKDFPLSMTTLKQLPREPVAAVTFLSLNPALSRTEAIVALLTITNSPLADTIHALARYAEIQVAMEAEKEPFIKLPHLDVQANQWIPTNQTVLVSFRATNSTPTAVLDALLKEHHLQPEFDAASGSYRLQSVHVSLEELLERLTRDEAQLGQLKEALQRPQAQLDWNTETPLMELPRPNYALLRRVTMGLGTRCKIHLLQGNPDAAFQDYRLIKRIGDMASSFNGLVGVMMKVTVDTIDPIEEGIAEGLWPVTYLSAFQKECADIDLLTPWSDALLYERAFRIEGIRQLAYPSRFKDRPNDYLYLFSAGKISAGSTPEWEKAMQARKPLIMTVATLAPRGWYYQSMADEANRLEERTAVDLSRQRVTGGTNLAHLIGVEAENWVRINSPHKIIALVQGFSIPNFIKTLIGTAEKQTRLHEIYLACALEHYRVAHGNYPEKLDALVPEFAARIPHDLFDGQPLRYRRTKDNRYLLYSIGWNSTDDGGVMDQPKEGESRSTWSDKTGDWVWQGVPER